MTLYSSRMDKVMAAKNLIHDDDDVVYTAPKAKDAVNDLLDRYFEKRYEKITSSVLEILSKKKGTAPNAPVKNRSFLSK